MSNKRLSRQEKNLTSRCREYSKRPLQNRATICTHPYARLAKAFRHEHHAASILAINSPGQGGFVIDTRTVPHPVGFEQRGRSETSAAGPTIDLIGSTPNFEFRGGSQAEAT